jgi:hypothetical protein
MRKILFLAALMLPVIVFGQLGIGIKAGLNFANITNASEINSGHQSGFMGGIFLAPQSKGIMSSRTEILYSRQGYSYESNSNTGNVNLDYILIPQLMSINITKFFSIQLGAQMAFLINAKADSNTSSGSSGSNPYGKIMDYYNKFDYGFCGGIEIHPFKGLLIGARYNISLGDLYKDPSSYMTPGGTPPSFIPTVNVKNNVVQIFAGWIFGGASNSKKKEQQQQQPQQ